MLANMTVDVSGLKGLHVPTSPDIFPLAVGWWLVAVSLAVLILFFYFIIYAWVHSLRRQVLRRLNKIKKITDNKKMLKSINQLAKQVAIARFGRKKVAPLYESEWVTFMNNSVKKEIFSKEYIDLLHKNIYAKKSNISDSKRQCIIRDYERWIRLILMKKGTH